MRVEKSQAILALLDSSSSSSSSTSSCKNKCHYGNLDKRQGLNRNLMRNSERNEIGKVKYCKQKKKWKNDN